MPDVREVYEMVTKQKPPQPGALERQQKRQVRAVRNKKIGAFVAAAAIGVLAIALILVARTGGTPTIPANQPPAVNPEGAAAEAGTVTFDGSTCSMEITADRIEPGIVLFEVVNASEQRAMFDSWQLSEGFTLRAFEARIERDRRLAEAPGNRGTFPSERQVTYLGSSVIAANSSGSHVSTMSPGRHAIVCLQLDEGGPSRFRPFGIVGPIVIR